MTSIERVAARGDVDTTVALLTAIVSNFRRADGSSIQAEEELQPL